MEYQRSKFDLSQYYGALPGLDKPAAVASPSGIPIQANAGPPIPRARRRHGQGSHQAMGQKTLPLRPNRAHLPGQHERQEDLGDHSQRGV